MRLENFLQPQWDAPANVQALITVKHEANLGARPQIMLPSPSISIKQVHGIDVARLPSLGQTPIADAVITTQPQVVCAVATADCLPILFTHKASLEVGAIHAGWRGLAAGVIQNTLRTLNYPVTDYLFWLGPCISEQAFEVESDVLTGFRDHNWSTELIDLGFQPKAQNPTKFLGNLRLLAQHVLLAAGLKPEQIAISNLCTYGDSELFHSYRRDKTRERMRSLIWIND